MMTDVSIIPSDEQTGLFLDSPMTETELAALEVHKAALRAAGEKQQQQNIATWEEQGKQLFAIYQKGLFRGAKGGRSWNGFLAAESKEFDPSGETGFEEDSARRRIAFYLIRDYLSAGTRAGGMLPTTLTQVDEMASQLPRVGGGNTGWSKYITSDPSAFDGIRKIWQGALNRARESGKDVPTRALVAEARRHYVADPANNARRLSPARQAQIEKVQAANRERHAAPEPAQPRSISPEALEQARADAEAREQREADQRRQQIDDHATGTINPLTIERGDGDLDAFDQCRKYHGLMISAYNAVQALEAFVESKVRTHGPEFFGFLRQVDAGSWSVASDLQTLKSICAMVQTSIDLADGTAEPAERDWEGEPTYSA